MLNLLKLHTNLSLRKNKSSRASMPYREADKVGIVFTVEDKNKHNQIKELIRKLESDGKNVSVVCYLPRDKQNYEFRFDFFTDKDLSFWGRITSETALKFCNTTFDYLFYLDTDPNPLILNLLARSKAKCRMGKYWEEGKPYFEFMLQNISGIQGLIDGMYKYTSLLR